MTNKELMALVKDCGLDWRRGYIPLFHGDPTNRYTVLVEATIEKFLNDSGQYLPNDATRTAAIAEATAPLLAQIEQLEALVKTLEMQSLASIEELNKRSARIADLERQLVILQAKIEPDCPKCGDNRQVWSNQITGKKTCHRAYCQTEID